nr:DNA-processing protein DprA [Palleronia aestuarii]
MRSRRVGISTFYRLLNEFGSAPAALEALPDIARSAGAVAYSPCPAPIAENEIRRGRLAGARLVAIGAPDYPPLLAAIPDPPPLLWVRGDADLLAHPPVALVGARNASSLGLRMARTLASGLGEAGAMTVSGLARGIDAAVHTASLATGTIAVMAGGIDVVYPAENAVLAQEIGERGLLVSEQPVGMQPQARHFPRRNRIVSGLARAVVVIEAAAKSGSLITARMALEQGREVLAVPGHPFDARAAGNNSLIRDGAVLIRGVRDVLEVVDLQPAPKPADRTPEPGAEKKARPTRDLRGTADLHALILERLGPSPTAEDELIRDLGGPAARVAAEIVTLELDGKLTRQPGGFLCRPPSER